MILIDPCWTIRQERAGLLDELRQERADDKYDNAADEYGDGLLWAALPFLQDDSPYVREHHVQCHEDAERQGVHGTVGLEERAAEA